MKKEVAINILDYLVKYGEECPSDYNISLLNEDEYIDGFHQWVDGKDILGIVNISNNDTVYYFTFIEWSSRNDGNYYIVIFSKNKSDTLAELHEVKEEYNSNNIEWKYIPRKQDGKNQERKECFKKYYGDVVKRIEVPRNLYEIEEFLNHMFDLVDKRKKSDDMIFSEEIKFSFPEGKLYERVHRKRERSSKLIELVKKERLDKDNKLACEICGFDFYEVYKELGKDFIEAHHTIPVSELNENSETIKEDIVLVCSNCHSMLHRKRPWATIEDIKQLL